MHVPARHAGGHNGEYRGNCAGPWVEQEGRDASARPKWTTISSMLTKLMNGH